MYHHVIRPERYDPKTSPVYALNDIDVRAPTDVIGSCSSPPRIGRAIFLPRIRSSYMMVLSLPRSPTQRSPRSPRPQPVSRSCSYRTAGKRRREPSPLHRLSRSQWGRDRRALERSIRVKLSNDPSMPIQCCFRSRGE
jgi:hypothetical protein